MKVILIHFLVFLSSFLIVGCASSEKNSILEERAQYNVQLPSINSRKMNSLKPLKASEKTTLVWIHPKALPNRDFFWGAWVSMIYRPEVYEKISVPRKPELKPKKPTLESNSKRKSL